MFKVNNKQVKTTSVDLIVSAKSDWQVRHRLLSAQSYHLKNCINKLNMFKVNNKQTRT